MILKNPIHKNGYDDSIMDYINCSVCREDAGLGDFVSCPCGYATCKKCAQSYILSSTQFAHCMKCKMEWSPYFLSITFGKQWLQKIYKEHRKSLALNREQSLTPKSLSEMSGIRSRRSDIEELENRIKDLRERLEIAKRQLHELNNPEVNPLIFICRCPIEDCRGMVESYNFTCIICKTVLCCDCYEPCEKDEKHECDKKLAEESKISRSYTKPCPKCTTSIIKIRGCDWLWCAKCSTVFRWNTESAEEEKIVNPYSLLWKREHGEFPYDVPDGSDKIFYNMTNIPPSLIEIPSILRVIRKAQFQIDPPIETFDDLRKSYIMKKKSEKQWAQSIFQRERDNEKKRVISQIIRAFVDLSVEKYRNLQKLLSDDKYNIGTKRGRGYATVECEKFISEMKKIRDFINDAFTNELFALGFKKYPQILVSSGQWDWSK